MQRRFMLPLRVARASTTGNAHTRLNARGSVDALRTHPYHFGFQCGAIAQLGERYNGIVEVAGSIPAGSTTFLVPIV